MRLVKSSVRKNLDIFLHMHRHAFCCRFSYLHTLLERKKYKYIGFLLLTWAVWSPISANLYWVHSLLDIITAGIYWLDLVGYFAKLIYCNAKFRAQAIDIKMPRYWFVTFF